MKLLQNFQAAVKPRQLVTVLRLWNHYCVRDSNVMDYKEFLKNFGLNTDTVKEKSTENQVPALTCQKIKEKEQKQKKLLQPSPAESAVTECSLDSTERAFREKLCSAYQDIEKAFRAIDVSQSGFVVLDYLKSVINGFIFPLPNETFQELMNRVNPVRGEDETFSGDTVLQKLYRYVQDAYPSLKQAFLMLDERRDGKITRDELHRILRYFLLQIKKKDFQKLIQIIDPEQTGYLDYHKFLDLVEEKESLVGHKWLNGTNQIKKIASVIVAWNTENIVDYAEKQWMALFVHCSKVDNSSGGIFYNMLLDSLEVAVPPDDLNGIGSHISKGRQQRKEKKQTDLSKRCWKIMPVDDNQFNLLTEKLGFPDGGLNYLDFVTIFEDARLNGPGATLCHDTNHRGNNAKYHYMTAEECLSQLNDKLMEVYGDTYSAFRNTDSNRDGIINMLDFRHLLDSFLFSLRDEEFLRLLGMLRMNLTSTLNYQEFCQLFQTQETEEVPPWLIPPHNVTVGSDANITDAELACDQAHYYLVIKARTRWHDLARSFQEYDSEGNVIIQPEDLKKVLFRFGIPVTPEEFKKLWARYDTDAKRYLTHQELLQKLGIEFAPADTGLSTHIAEDNCAHLKAHYNNQQKKHSKLEEQQKQQTKALHVNEMKKQINDFGSELRMCSNERRLCLPDPLEPKCGEACIDSRVKRLGGILLGFPKFPQTVPDVIEMDKFRDYFQDFNKVFQKMDKNRGGYITVCDLHKILQEFSYLLDYDQFSGLLNGLGISIHDSKLSYFDFLRAIDDGRASKYQQRQKQAAPPASFAALSLEKTLIKIKEMVTSSYDLLYKAFSLFDKEDTGVIKALEFQQVLDHFCFKLSDKQFRHLLKSLKLFEDLTVNWKIFLKNINLHSETKEGQKVILPKSSRELSKKGILSRIQEVVTARFNTIAKEFKDIDSSKDNTVSKEEFWDICNRHFLLLTEEQFENLWNTVDVNAGGWLKYQDFLKKFSSGLVTMPSSTFSTTSSASSTKPVTSAMLEPQVSSQPERPKTSSSLGGQKRTPASSRPQTTAACSGPVLNCEPIENKIRENIKHSWRKILKECKEKDVSKQGEIPVSDFLDIAEKLKLYLSEEEVNQITTKYDFKNNGKFTYCDFLQSCILFLKPQETSLLQRMIIQKPQILLSPGPQTTSFFSAVLRIQPQILHCWRPMRRTFKSYDESRTGLLNIPDFRQVLHECSIILTEEELFNILEYYDKTLSSKISYNDFLRAFLQYDLVKCRKL
ncbi:EF-hand calcium-binding domain-containing protein 6 [Apteryx mantelli]|uniref:EF-hand calcium-binding domain-containing protein 6 n=1 Tax=Apteryx mantelli TaxID=2696672 RepID=A0ABM4EDQ0_9AVES